MKIGNIGHPLRVTSFILISVLVTAVGVAQKKSIRFQHFTIEDGLPQNMVDCILEDSKGFMWFGTWNGVCRYDGYNFKEINGEQGENNQQLSNFVYAITEDNYGNIWIGTETGLAVYLYSFEKLKYYDNLNESWPFLSEKVSVILQDGEKIWIGGKRGIAELLIKTDAGDIEVSSVFKFGLRENELSGNEVNCIAKDRNDNLWIGTNQGISVLKKSKKEFTHIVSESNVANGLPNSVVQAIFEDSKGVIWVGTENGLSELDKQTGKFINYFHSPFSEFSLIHNSVTDILEDSQGNIIVATLGGLSILEKNNQNQFINYASQSNSEYELNNDFINCLYKDSEGSIWIGTERGGINKYNSTRKILEYFENEVNNLNSLSNNTINSILEDDNYIWIGTAGGGLNRFDKLTKKYTFYKNAATDPTSIPNNFITSLKKRTPQKLMIGTWGGGLCELDLQNPSNHSFIIHQTGQNDQSLVNNFVSSILKAPNGEFWIGTLGGLDRYNPITNKFKHIAVNTEGHMISQVGCLTYDGEGSLWVGTRVGLYKIEADRKGEIDIDKAKVTVFTNVEGDPNSLSGNYVIALLNDKNGNLWVSTYGKGVNLLVSEKNNGTFEKFTKQDGLSNNIVYTITEDNNGVLWFATDNGLSKYDPEAKQFQNFYSNDGLQNDQYYWAAAYKNMKGKLYFGGMNGLNAFYPSWLNTKTEDLKVVLTDFRIFNESVKVGEKYGGRIVLTNTISETKEIEISYKSNEFLFEFSALDFKQSDINEYAYMLEGFDKDWNFIGANRRFASYTNLEQGEYIFKVKASNGKGKWTKVPASVKIIIIPPFWKTLWFKIIMIAFVIFLTISYNQYRIYSLRVQKKKLEIQVKDRTIEIKKQNEQLGIQNKLLADKKELIEGQKLKLEKQNEEILAQRDNLLDLHKKVKIANQYKLKFFTNVSHEFRTPLTLILGPIEKLLKEQRFDEGTKNTLNLISRNAQRLLHLINQLMEFRKVEKGKMKLKISKIDLARFTKNLSGAFQELANNKNTELLVDLGKLPDEAWMDYEKIENILYNLLSNAFKYTKEGGKVWLKVYLKDSFDCPEIVRETTFESENQVIVFEVSDTGKGIKEENLKCIFNRFYREKTQQNKGVLGSGVGLSLAKELIKIHSGKIKVSSKYGEGSSFYILFPIGKESYKENELYEIEYNPENIQKQVNELYNQYIQEGKYYDFVHQKKLKNYKNRSSLLIVEDNEDLRDFLAIKLNDSYNILEAENGKVGFDMAIVHNPSLIISDIMMPEMDGIELCKSIKENIATSHIPVILLTAKSNVESRLEGLQTGADDYLSKPFNFSLLEARIKNLIESRKKLMSGYSSKIDVKPEEMTSTKVDELFLKKAIELVENNLDNPEFGVSDLIANLNMSRSSLHKKFTALTNQSTIDFINGVKLKKSIFLLQKLNMNISEVAYSAGFNDPKYYSRIFKKTFGKTPTEYQKELIDS